MRHILTFFLMAISLISASAQSADSIAGEYLNHSEWFKLNALMKDSSSDVSTFIRQFAKAMTANAFNKPSEACDEIKTLINTYQEQMGGSNTLTMITLLADNMSKTGDNKGAAAAIDKIISALSGQVDEKTLNGYVSKKAYYDALSHYDLFKSDSNNQRHNTPFRLVSIENGDTSQSYRMIVDGQLNGKRMEYVFDTGASMNVVTPKTARDCKMKLLETSVNVSGIKTNQGRIAIAGTIKIGDVVMHNVPFTVLDMATDNDNASTAIGQIRAIIGLTFMTQYDEIDIDFTKKDICLLSDTKTKTSMSNICFDGSTLIGNVIENGKPLKINIDCGGDKSQLHPSYYKTHTTEISKYGKWKIGAAYGYGGRIYQSIFSMPAVTFSFASSELTLRNIDVIALMSHNSTLFRNDGTFGMDYFLNYDKVCIDFKNMIMRFY